LDVLAAAETIKMFCARQSNSAMCALYCPMRGVCWVSVEQSSGDMLTPRDWELPQ
jgi:hypothetical protein